MCWVDEVHFKWFPCLLTILCLLVSALSSNSEIFSSADVHSSVLLGFLGSCTSCAWSHLLDDYQHLLLLPVHRPFPPCLVRMGPFVLMHTLSNQSSGECPCSLLASVDTGCKPRCTLLFIFSFFFFSFSFLFLNLYKGNRIHIFHIYSFKKITFPSASLPPSYPFLLLSFYFSFNFCNDLL